MDENATLRPSGFGAGKIALVWACRMGRLQSAFAVVIVAVMGASFLYAQTLSPQPAGTISGVVLDAAGKPYAGAQVWTMEVGPHQFRHWEDSYAPDAQGRFRLTVVPGSYFVCAFPPGVPLDKRKWLCRRVSPRRRPTPLPPPLLYSRMVLPLS